MYTQQIDNKILQYPRHRETQIRKIKITRYILAPLQFMSTYYKTCIIHPFTLVTVLTRDCTDSRPRARGYQLRGLPLVGSECVFPQCNSSFVITRGSAKPPAFGLPVHLSRAHQKRKQNRWNSRHNNFSNCQMAHGTTTVVQHPPKAHLGLPTTSWIRPSSFDKT